LLKSEHAFANDRKTKVPGLDSPGMHRPDGDFVHAVTDHQHEGIVINPN
jgi:hypothetical protein